MSEKHTCGLSAEDRRCNADPTCRGCVGKWATIDSPTPKNERPDDYSKLFEHQYDTSSYIKVAQSNPRIIELESENTLMRQQIREAIRFTVHKPLCGIVGGYGYCTCGLDEALKQIQETR